MQRTRIQQFLPATLLTLARRVEIRQPFKTDRNMTKHFLLLLVAILLLVASGVAQTLRKQTKTTPAKSGVTDIRRIDFRNFTYRSSVCSEVFGIPKTVRVRRGKFQNNDFYYRVVANNILYGDVTADGHEEAIVHIGCGGFAGNFSDSEVFIYALQNGQAKLLAKLDTRDLERDYLRYYPDGFLVDIANDGVKVRNGHLIVEKFADGSRATPEYIVTLDYKLSGTSLTLSGKPHRASTPLDVQRAPTPVDLTSASDSELQQHLGERVTMHGRFSLFGKLGPFILLGGRPIYLVPKGSFSWGEPYSSMEGRDVRVTGTLRFAHYPKPPAGALPEARAPDHFYFEAETAKVELS